MLLSCPMLMHAEEIHKTVELRDKTIVAWVRTGDLGQQGGAVLSVQEGERFDALVLGEREPGKWMAGSEMFNRTTGRRTDIAETAAPDEWVQVAIAYAGPQVRVYRNGAVLEDFTVESPASFGPTTELLFGLRLCFSAEQGFFHGDIDEVRLYDRALSREEILDQHPDKLTGPTPLGWWTFDQSVMTDRMGNFPPGNLIRGATIRDGHLQLNGTTAYAIVTWRPKIQAGFFTPWRKGQIWDTWLYFHNHYYFMYYLAGPGGHWDGHALAISPDGVHWEGLQQVVPRAEGVTWMGTGHIWKDPDFERHARWIMNYSEWRGPKQDINFVMSPGDLRVWTKLGEEYRFVQDTRWYKAEGRWDCIDTLARADGSLLGYFTADPNPEKLDYEACGFGMAESRDGLHWTALPPPPGDIGGELGGIQQIGERYFVLVSEGRVGMATSAMGPFHAQRKNPNAFGEGCDIYFPRFFHNAPGGPLVNHFYTGGVVHAAPLKAIDVDDAGILRLKWWRGNDRLKTNAVAATLHAAEQRAGAQLPLDLHVLSPQLNPMQTHVIEGELSDLPETTASAQRRGVWLDTGTTTTQCLLLTRTTSVFADLLPDGGLGEKAQISERDLHFHGTVRFRLVLHKDMLEFYVNDYLMNLKRTHCNGRIGIIGADPQVQIKVWSSETVKGLFEFKYHR